jgi:ubiquinone/menaquinone biosynthesis C-methylase UbiE
MCLVCHELPRDATKRIMEEAMRVLRPGGAIAIMEMDPNSAFVDKLRKNLFAFTALKSTEPYLDDYMTFPIVDALKVRDGRDAQRPECRFVLWAAEKAGRVMRRARGS